MNSEFAIRDGKADNYRSDRGARAYKSDHENRVHRKLSTARELKIFGRFFDRLGSGESVLDLPCGHGRLLGVLQGRFAEVIEADFSPQMLELNESDHAEQPATSYLKCSALDIPLPERAVDVAFSIRLNHHLETQEAREAHLLELFRVANRAVIVSWFSATSLKNLWRRARAPFNRKSPKNTLANRRAREIGRRAGFDLVESRPLSRVGSGHVFGLFVRCHPDRSEA
jgi:ubiquinone/menaquinone biosynthesis C-methylase UbiE